MSRLLSSLNFIGACIFLGSGSGRRRTDDVFGVHACEKVSALLWCVLAFCREQLRLNLEIADLNAALYRWRRRGMLPHGDYGAPPPSTDDDLRYLLANLDDLREEMTALFDAVGKERRAKQSPDYIDAIITGNKPARVSRGGRADEVHLQQHTTSTRKGPSFRASVDIRIYIYIHIYLSKEVCVYRICWQEMVLSKPLKLRFWRLWRARGSRGYDGNRSCS